MFCSRPGVLSTFWSKPRRRRLGRPFSPQALETRLVPADVAVQLQGRMLSMTGNEDNAALNIELTGTDVRITAGNGTTTFNGNPNFIQPISGPVALKLKLTGNLNFVRLHGTVLGREFASINATLGTGLDVFQVIDSRILGKTLIKAGSGDNRVQIQDATLNGQLQVKSPADTQLAIIDSKVNGLTRLTLGPGSEMEITGGATATRFSDRFFANLGSDSMAHLGPNLHFDGAVSFKGKGPHLPGIGAVDVSVPGNPKIKDIVFVVRQTSPSSDVPKPIPLVGTVTSTLNVGQLGLIVDVNVSLNLTHTWDEDLDIVLISPAGTHVPLTSDNGGDFDNYTNTVFNDEAIRGIDAGQAPFVGTFSPEGLLTMLNQEAAAGTWTLEITDDTSGDSGTLLGWSVTITSNSLVPPV